MPLYGHELSETINPFAAGVGWAVKLDKGEFVGRDALRSCKARPGLTRDRPARSKASGSPARARSCWRATARSAWSPRGRSRPTLQAEPGDGPGRPAGRGASAPRLTVDVRGHREPASVVKLPFYKRPSRRATAPDRRLRSTRSDSDRPIPRGPRSMDPKTLRFTPTHEWVHLEGDIATVGISQVRRRSIDRPDHDRPAGRRDQARRRQELRRGRERQGGQRPVRPGRRRGHRGQRRGGRQRPAPRRRPLRQGLADQDPGRRPVRRRRSSWTYDAYEKKVAEEDH